MNLLIAWLCVCIFCVFCAVVFWFYAILIYCAVLGVMEITERIKKRKYDKEEI